MARDAMDGFIEILIEDGEDVPESDAPHVAPRFDILANTLRDDGARPVIEQITVEIAVAA